MKVMVLFHLIHIINFYKTDYQGVRFEPMARGNFNSKKFSDLSSFHRDENKILDQKINNIVKSIDFFNGIQTNIKIISY